MKKMGRMIMLFFALAALAANADLVRPVTSYRALTESEWREKLGLRPDYPRSIGMSVFAILALCDVALVVVLTRRRRIALAISASVCAPLILLPVAFFALEKSPSKASSAVVLPLQDEVVERTEFSRTIIVGPKVGEPYDEYTTRVRRMENDLCLKCGNRLKHAYRHGHVTYCDECDRDKPWVEDMLEGSHKPL